MYKDICIASNENYVARSTFFQIWNTFCLDIVIMKPKSDLCELCQKNYTSHARLRGATDEEKAAKCQEHLHIVDDERAAYKAIIKETIQTFEDRGNQTVREGEKYVPNPTMEVSTTISISLNKFIFH